MPDAATKPTTLKGELSEAEKQAVESAEKKLEKQFRKGQAKKQAKPELPTRRPWGSCGSFAGRRPPLDPVKLKEFQDLKCAYEAAVKDRKVKSEGSDRQKQYWSFMQSELQGAAASSDDSPKKAFANAVKKWQALHTEEVGPDTADIAESKASLSKKRQAGGKKSRQQKSKK